MKNPTVLIACMLIFSTGMFSCSEDEEPPECRPDCMPQCLPECLAPPPPPPVAKIENFTFSDNGVSTAGKIYLPAAYTEDSDWASIYLIDYHEQHWEVATDEYDQLIQAMNANGIKALVITLQEHLDIEVLPEDYEQHSNTFKNMAEYVHQNYSDNTSRAFVGRGSEAGVVLLTMLTEDPESRVFNKYIATDASTDFNNYVINMMKNEDIPEDTQDVKLHFSYTSSNERTVCETLIETIDGASYPWLSFAHEEYPNLIYTEAYPTAFADGLAFVF